MRKPIRAIAAIVVVALSGHAVAQPAPAPAPAPAPSEPAGSGTAQPAPATSVPAPPPPAPPPPAPPPPSFGPPSQLEPPKPGPRQPRDRILSERLAFGLSFGTTLVSWTAVYLDGRDRQSGVPSRLGFLGVLLGPSVGHWYRRAFLTRGMLLRAVGTGIAIFAVSLDCDGDSCDRFARWALGGTALVLLGSLDDIITAPLRVRTHNRQLQDVALVPVVTPHSAGLALSGRF